MRVNIDPALLRHKLDVWQAWFKAEKPVFQISVGVLAIGFLLSLINPIYNFFSYTPSSLFLLHIWRPFTAAITETNVFLLLWSVLAFHQLTEVISPLWGLNEVLKFCLIVHFVTLFALSMIALGFFALFGAVDFFYFAHLNGLAPVNVAALVAIKQFLPDTVLITTSKGRLKNNHLPLSSLTLVIIAYLVGLVRYGVIFQTAMGIQVSWTYLRFIQKRELRQGEKGDQSDHFAWHTLFPRITQPFFQGIGKIAYRSLFKLRLLKKVDRMILPQVNEDTMFELDLDREAERKRQIALRELQARLMQQKRASPIPPARPSQPLAPVPEAREPTPNIPEVLPPLDLGSD
ncbi:unnamed protein product [Bursaphelenchus xylophilus]|uniref:(pine wood nematode) hypothetical protein n=1 Tax=Bursaphelenchus xylophilus TaxID=6326 RepID=A0A1I7RUF9_BURXY|nr:unnamed protein product [Bursaphelenchus xylophilus]CAG9114098.1 unnamed protein product [Bursaphelenchus xylophilus]